MIAGPGPRKLDELIKRLNPRLIVGIVGKLREPDGPVKVLLVHGLPHGHQGLLDVFRRVSPRVAVEREDVDVLQSAQLDELQRLGKRIRPTTEVEAAEDAAAGVRPPRRPDERLDIAQVVGCPVAGSLGQRVAGAQRLVEHLPVMNATFVVGHRAVDIVLEILHLPGSVAHASDHGSRLGKDLVVLRLRVGRVGVRQVPRVILGHALRRARGPHARREWQHFQYSEILADEAVDLRVGLRECEPSFHRLHVLPFHRPVPHP